MGIILKIKKLLRSYLLHSGKRLPEFLLTNDDRAMRRMAKLVGKDDTVIDLGAHVGLASIEFAQTACHVYAFEPDPKNFSELLRNTRSFKNITVSQNAVSDQTGKASLYFEHTKRNKYFEGSTIIEGKSNISYNHKVEIDTISVDDMMTMVPGYVALIKMDIEGAEYRVLDSLISSDYMERIGKIYVECHVDRIPSLAEAKMRTLNLAKARGVLHKLDFTWP